MSQDHLEQLRELCMDSYSKNKFLSKKTNNKGKNDHKDLNKNESSSSSRGDKEDIEKGKSIGINFK